MPVTVTIDNFVRVETNTMIGRMLPIIGGLARFITTVSSPPSIDSP